MTTNLQIHRRTASGGGSGSVEGPAAGSDAEQLAQGHSGGATSPMSRTTSGASSNEALGAAGPNRSINEIISSTKKKWYQKMPFGVGGRPRSENLAEAQQQQPQQPAAGTAKDAIKQPKKHATPLDAAKADRHKHKQRTPQEQMQRLQEHTRNKVTQVQKEKRELERKIDHLQAQLRQIKQQGSGEAPPHDPLMGIPRQRMPDRMGNMFPLVPPRADPLEQFKAQQRARRPADVVPGSAFERQLLEREAAQGKTRPLRPELPGGEGGLGLQNRQGSHTSHASGSPGGGSPWQAGAAHIAYPFGVGGGELNDAPPQSPFDAKPAAGNPGYAPAGIVHGELNGPPPASPFVGNVQIGGELNGPPPASPFGGGELNGAPPMSPFIGGELNGAPPMSPFGGGELNGPPPVSPFGGGEMNGAPPASPFGGGKIKVPEQELNGTPAAASPFLGAGFGAAYAAERAGAPGKQPSAGGQETARSEQKASPFGGEGGELNGPAPASPFGGPAAGNGRMDGTELMGQQPPVSPWGPATAATAPQVQTPTRGPADTPHMGVELNEAPVPSPFAVHDSTSSSSIQGLSTLPTPNSGELANNQQHAGRPTEELSGHSSLTSPFDAGPHGAQQQQQQQQASGGGGRASHYPLGPLSTVDEESGSQQALNLASEGTSPAGSLMPGAHEELNPRPSLTSPFEAAAPAQHASQEPSGPAASNWTAGGSSPAAGHGPVLAAAAIPSQDFVRSPFDASGQLEAASSSGAQQQGGSGPHVLDRVELNHDHDMPSPFASGLIREGSLSLPPKEDSAMINTGELNGRPSLSTPFAPGYGASLTPPDAAQTPADVQSAGSTPAGRAGAQPSGNTAPTADTVQRKPVAQLGPELGDLILGSGEMQRTPFEGGELNSKASYSSPFERKSVSSGTGSQTATSATSRSFSKVASFDEWKSSDDSAAEAMSTDLNPRPSLRSPFEHPSFKQRQPAEGTLIAEGERGSGHAAPFEGGELNPRPSLSSPFEPQSNRGRPPKQPRSTSLQRESAEPSPPAEQVTVPQAEDETDAAQEAEAKPPALAARMSITPAPASPFDEPAEDPSAAAEPLTTAGSQTAPADKQDKLHAHVDAAHEAPLMVATLSSMRAPVSPFGDDDSAAADVGPPQAEGGVQAGVMSAQLSAGWVPISPFGDEEEPSAGPSAMMTSQMTPPSPFAFAGDEPEDQATPPLRSLASRPSFVPSAASSATTDVPAGSSILWGKGTQIPSSSFHISANPSAGTTVSNSRPSPRASQDAPTSARSAALAAAGSDTAGITAATSQRAQSAQPSPSGSPLAVHAESEASPLAARPLASHASGHMPRSMFEDDAGDGRQSGDEGKHREGSEERARAGGLSTRTSARTGGPSTLPSNVSRASTTSRRESESGALPEDGLGDTMMLMEAYSKLQRENLRLQAKVLRMEDASGKVTQLEELNAKLKKENVTLQTAVKKQPSGGLFGGGDKTSAKQLAEARSELEAMRRELTSYQAENEQLTMDNVKLINHLEEMSNAFGVDLDDPDHYAGAPGDIHSTAHTDSGELSGYAP